MWNTDTPNRRQFVGLLSATALTMPLASAAFSATGLDADRVSRRRINLAGRQRMLSQRMSRAALFNSLGIEQDRHLAMLAESYELFDRTLIGLKSGDDGLELPRENKSVVLSSLSDVQNVWAGFGNVVKGIIDKQTVTEQDVQTVAVMNTDVLALSNLVVEKMVDEYGNQDIEIGLAVSINLAGRQRMFSQKIAKEAALVGLGYQVDQSRKDLAQTTGLFGATLTALMEGLPSFTLPKPPEHVRAKLVEVADIWKDYGAIAEGVAQTGQAETEQLESVAQIADPLLTTMNDAVTLYEQL